METALDAATTAADQHDRPAADPYQVYLDSLESDESQRTMRGALDRIARMQTGDPEATGAWQPWWLLRYEHTTQIRARLIETGHSPSHINKHLIALRRVLRVCWRMGLISAEDYERAKDVRNMKGSRLPAGRSIHQDEIAAMLLACDGGAPAARRDAALIAVLYSTGIRRTEAAAVLIELYDPAERTLRVVGKGDKERITYLMPDAALILERWLARLDKRRGPIFRPVHRHGVISPRALTPRAIGHIVTRIRKKAGLAPLTAHDYRRTFIGDYIDAGGDLAQAQQIAGHASVTTTAQYDRRPGRAKKAVVDRMSLPLRPGKT